MATTTEPAGHPVVHFLEDVTVLTSMSSLGVGRVLGFGDELILTPEIRQANMGRNGRSIFDFIAQGADGYVRHGRTICRRGPWPAGASRLQPGSHVWEESRRQAIAAALALEDPVKRRAARLRAEEEYGPSRPASRTPAQLNHRDGQAAQ